LGPGLEVGLQRPEKPPTTMHEVITDIVTAGQG
jgi:hypothetical protein